jgi:hypothetical protein
MNRMANKPGMFSGDVTRYLAICICVYIYIVCWLIALRGLVMTHRHIISTPFKLHSNSSSTSERLPHRFTLSNCMKLPILATCFVHRV